MRDLMKEYCESSDYTKIATHKKRRTNGQSISEVMSEVCGKIQVTWHFDVIFMIM